MLSFERSACRSPKLFLIRGKGRQRHAEVEQMLRVRAEGELGNARMKSQQRRLSGKEQVVGWALRSGLGPVSEGPAPSASRGTCH